MKSLILILVIIVIAGVVVFLPRQEETENPQENPEISDEDYEGHYEPKQAALERILGPMHGLVGHAIIPFQAGGTVDMYYFPNGIPGTGFATMELIEPDGSGPKPNRIGTYELVAFTRQKIPTPEDVPEDHPFNLIERRICGTFTTIGSYSYEAVLNPGETCELPGKDEESTRCLIFYEYAPHGIPFEIDGKKHCLLLCLEVFRSEMEYAMENGSTVVIKKLKEAGRYPYSDLDREPVY
jgi:hypothetical protein